MMNFRKKSHSVPELNTSSLPDLIFSVLFFFMIVTHMRQVTLKVECRMPEGKNLTRLTKKSAVSHIYIGKPTKDLQGKYGSGTQIQMNDKFASASDVQDYISAEKKRMSPEDQKLMTVSIKADQDTRMGVITDVKQALRQACKEGDMLTEEQILDLQRNNPVNIDGIVNPSRKLKRASKKLRK